MREAKGLGWRVGFEIEFCKELCEGSKEEGEIMEFYFLVHILYTSFDLAIDRINCVLFVLLLDRNGEVE